MKGREDRSLGRNLPVILSTWQTHRPVLLLGSQGCGEDAGVAGSALHTCGG